MDLYGLLYSVLLAFGYVLVPLAPVGFLVEEDESKRLFYLFCSMAITLILVIWPFRDHRFSFLLAPSLIPLSVNGANWIANKLASKPPFRIVEQSLWMKLLLLLYLIINNYKACIVLLRVFT